MANPSPTTQLLLNVLSGRAEVPPEVDWSLALPTLERHRLAGLAWTLKGWKESVPAHVLASLEVSHHRQAAVGSVILDHAAKIVALLGEAGLPAVLFKGASLVAQGLYRGPGERGFSDADLLVPRSEAEQAIRILVDSGYAPWNPNIAETIGWSDAGNFRLAPPHQALNATIDLHWATEYGSLRFGPGQGSGEQGPVGRSLGIPEFSDGGPFRHPSHEAHLVLTLEHVLKHLRFRIHLPGLADSVRLSRVVQDWDAVARDLRKSAWHRGCLALLVNLARETECVPPEALAPLQTEGLPTEHLSLPRLVNRVRLGVTPLGGIVNRWRITGARTILADTRAALFPPQAWLRSRYPNRSHSRTSLWFHHARRIVAWGFGVSPSPLSPDQDEVSDRQTFA